MKKYLRANEYCELYRISKITFYRHVKDGTIEHIRIGRNILVPVDDDLIGTTVKEVSSTITDSIHPQISNIQAFFDKISPEIMDAFENPPVFGSIKVEVTYHDGEPVKVECGKSIKKKIIN